MRVLPKILAIALSFSGSLVTSAQDSQPASRRHTQGRQPQSRPARPPASRPSPQERTDAALRLACGDLNLDQATKLLDQGASPNVADPKTGQTPLLATLQAVRRTDSQNRAEELVDLLLRKGAEPGLADADGMTPLLVASSHKNEKSVQLLLAHGASVKEVDHDGRTALMYAAQTRIRYTIEPTLDILQQLLTAGADINARDLTGQTALLLAVTQQINESGGFVAHPEVAELLLKNGADINSADNQGETPLIRNAAVWHGDPAVIETLLKNHARVDAVDAEGRTALMRAIRPANLDVMKLLLPAGASLTTRDKAGDSALRIAIESGQPDVVNLLTDAGATPQSADLKSSEEVAAATRDNALFRACEQSETDKITALLNQGAALETRDRTGRTALLRAAASHQYSNKDSVCELLLKRGADITARDKEGNTALMLASADTRRDMVRQLLEHGADPNLRNAAGRTALLNAAEASDHVAVPLLLDHGADVKARAADGQTALHYALTHHYSDQVTNALFKAGAEIDVADNAGRTPLMVAAEYANLDLVELLLHKGANKDARDNSGQSVLAHARKAYADPATVPADHDALEQIISLLTRAKASE